MTASAEILQQMQERHTALKLIYDENIGLHPGQIQEAINKTFDYLEKPYMGEPMCPQLHGTSKLRDEAFIFTWYYFQGDQPLPGWAERGVYVEHLRRKILAVRTETSVRSKLVHEDANNERPELLKGPYRHYRHGVYIVTGVARLHDTNTDYVIFHPEGYPDVMWVRTLTDFNRIVEVDGAQVQRFTFIPDYPIS